MAVQVDLVELPKERPRFGRKGSVMDLSMRHKLEFELRRREEEVRDLQKKMQQLESDLDVTQEKLLNANQKLEEKEKALLNAEGEVAALNRRIQMLEEDLEKSEERLLIATQKLDQASTAADDNQRMCKVQK